MPKTLDQALTERNRQMRAYRQAKKAQLLELYADPMHGEWLRKFVATLGHFKIEHADRFVEYVENECRKWLAAAPEDIRFAALEACDERIQKIRLNAGLPPFDDSLPDSDPDIFQVCKKTIGL